MMIISRMVGIPMAVVMIITPDPVVSRMTALAVPMENTVHRKGKKAPAPRSGTETDQHTPTGTSKWVYHLFFHAILVGRIEFGVICNLIFFPL
jgi:hypothetical protein